jgi:hypothetical protein
VKWILRVKPKFQEHGTCFLVHNSAPAHSALIGQHCLATMVRFRCHQSYFPELIPADFSVP